MARKHPEWVLKIYGEGNKGALEALAKKLDITNQVRFYEPVTDIMKVYLGASMILNTSRFEPFGLAMIEGMACGLPAIAYGNASGPASYIVDGYNGFLIEKDDLQSYADKICLMIDDEMEIKSLSENAKESTKVFDIER